MRDVSRFVKPIEVFEPPAFELVNTIQDARNVLDLLQGNCSYDIETGGLDWHINELICTGISSQGKHIVYSEEFINSPDFKPYFESLAKRTDLSFYGHNAAAFDQPFMSYNLGFEWPTKWDTMLLHFCADERKNTHGLKDIAQSWYGVDNYEGEVSKYLDKTYGYRFAPRDLLYKYLACDTAITERLFNDVMPLVQEGKLLEFHDFAFPISKMYGDIGFRWSTGRSTLLREVRARLGG